jgi:nitroreductase
VEFGDVVRARHMARAFQARPVDPLVVDSIVDAGRRAPSAGHAQGWAFVVLEGAEQTARFWDITLPLERRSTFRWPQLLDAPVIILPLADREAYLARYREPDKVRTGLGDPERWPVPYWQVDTAFAVMTMLLAATDAGLGSLFFGVFHRSAELLADLAIPDGHELIGAIALGHPLPSDPGRSAGRGRRDGVVHRGRWNGTVATSAVHDERSSTRT